MNIKLDTLKEQCEIHFQAIVEGDEWKNAQQAAIADLAKNVTVKGFRKGKAPVQQAARYIKAQDVLEKAADRAVNKAYNEMINKNNVRPIIQPELVVEEFNAEKLSFKFVVVTAPVVELGEYKGLTIEKKQVRVLKADIDAELQAMANKNAELVVLGNDEPAKMGDTVVIDFKGFVDGEAFDGGEAASYDLELGSGTFIPGFEDQLVGVKTGDDKDVTVKFPEQYVANLSGKEALFKVHVNAIKSKEIPAIDDDLAKDADIEGVDTLDQLKEHLKGVIKERKVKEQDNDRLNELMNKVIDGATFTCHSKLLEEDAKRIQDDFKKRIEQQGFDIEDYLKMTNKTLEDLHNEALEESMKNAKRELVISKIAVVENIDISPKEVEDRINEIAKSYNMDPKEIKKQLADRINGFAANMRQEKVVKFLKENNNL